MALTPEEARLLAAELARLNSLTAETDGVVNRLSDTLRNNDIGVSVGKLATNLTNDIKYITDELGKAQSRSAQQVENLKTNLEKSLRTLNESVNSLIENTTSAWKDVDVVELTKKVQDAALATGASIGEADAALTGYIDSLAEVRKVEEEYYNAKKEQFDLDLQQKLLDETMDEDLEERKRKIQASTILEAAQKDAILDAAISHDKLTKAIKEAAYTRENTNKLMEREANATKAEIGLRIEQIRHQRELTEEEQNALESKIRLAKLEEISKKNTKEATMDFKNLADSMFGASNKSNLFSKSLLTLISAKDGLKSGLTDLGTAIKTGFVDSLFGAEAVINRLGGFINERIINSTFKFAEAVAKLNKETGGVSPGFGGPGFTSGGAFKSFATPGLATYGIGIDKYLETQGKLMNQFNQLATMTDVQQNKVIANAAKLGNLGVQTETYGKILQGYFGAVGKTIDAADESVNKLAKDAIGMGLSVAQYLSKFEQLMPKIIAYGREASTIFKELTALSQATKGIITESDLSALADKFSTFDGAAEQVSKLNAMLGGTSIGIQDVMGKDPAEIAFAIKRAADESGVNFDKLNRGYKQLLAEAFGGDMQKAAAFFNANMAKANQMLAMGSAEQEELNKKAEESATAQQKLASAIDNVRIAFTPIIEIVSKVADALIWVEKNLGLGRVAFVAFTTLVVGAAAVWNAFRSAAATAIEGIRAPLIELRMELTAIKNEMLGIQATPYGGVKTRGAKGGFMSGIGGRSVLTTLIASAAIAGVTAAVASSDSDSDSEKRTYNAVVDKPLSAPVGYDRKISNTRTGDEYFVSNGDTLIGTQQGEKLYDRVFGSERIKSDTSRFASTTRESNSSFFNNAVASFSSMFSSVGQTFAQHFVKETVEAAKSGDTTISNVFGGNKGDTHVHVVANLDGQNILANMEKRIVNDPRRIATAVAGHMTSKV